ncbi:hypothetical protein T01_4236 [Trichinella spiralis]|uniref:Uncharacterized protein n=1 Tax=Trichinella spiralis TaxID=6334 RepID=A0A0V0Z9S1_TRISP|nr:hypothetical protein T01_4236 [Trichinella spiralis]
MSENFRKSENQLAQMKLILNEQFAGRSLFMVQLKGHGVFNES